MPVINGVYLKDFAALPSAVVDANIIPIAISGNQIAYRTTVGGIVTDARVTSKLLTGLSVTGGAVVATDTILQAFGKVQNQINSKVSSVGLTMPSAFSVANSPITSAGTLAVTAIGAASQYIRGDGALADFPTTGGGGSSVAYYLNGSVSQGTIGGNTYYEMNKTPVIGTGTDFTIGADGYIAQFITDANDPASLLIPAGNWNVEMYFSASSSGGTPSFYVEVYKYNGTTFTLLGSSATTPEGITNGTAIDIYYTSVGIPETVLAITDRLAIRVYVTHSGRTITLHTEDNHLSEIITTFSNGLTALNGLTKQAQYFAVGSTGTDFNIASSVDTHTFNIPSASASARGLITTGAQTIAGEKTFTTSGRTTFTNADFFQSEFSNGSSKLNLGSSSGKSYIYSSGDLRFGTNYPTDSLSSPKLIISTSGLVTIPNQLRLDSTITNGTYTYTLPSATGTLALTSALSGYLPLTGGTLTGSLTINGGGLLTLLGAKIGGDAGGTIDFNYNTGGTPLFTWWGGTTSSKFSVTSTGAATFSSSVTGGAGADGSGYMLKGTDGVAFRAIDPTATGGGASNVNIGAIGTASGDFRIHATNVLFLSNGGTAERMRITSGGNVGIGTTDLTSVRLRVKGVDTTSSNFAAYFENSSAAAMLVLRNDGLVAFPQINNFTTGNSPNTWINPASSYGIYINTSSRKYKKDISNYDKGIDIVNQLRPVYYKGISEVDGDKQFVGLIAEEIHDLGLTEFVNYNEEGLPNSLSYPNMIALAFKAIQELSEKIKTLENK